MLKLLALPFVIIKLVFKVLGLLISALLELSKGLGQAVRCGAHHLLTGGRWHADDRRTQEVPQVAVSIFSATTDQSESNCHTSHVDLARP